MGDIVYIVWKDEFSVGSAKLDAQHKYMFGLINELFAAIRKGHETEKVKQVIDGALDYGRMHFADEERIMLQCGFPQFPSHRQIHQDYTPKIKGLMADYQRRLGDISSELLRFLKTWWLNHILNMDKEYAPYLADEKTHHARPSQEPGTE
jgi:hemerythrin-like metal-binding protein